jgi:hypothetical protein
VKEFIEPLKWYKDDWLTVSLQIGEKAMQNADEAGAAAVDYLMYSGYVVLAYFWARMAVVAQAKIAAGEGDSSFYEAKLHTARFYFQRLLPRAASHREALLSGADNLMDMEAMFAFCCLGTDPVSARPAPAARRCGIGKLSPYSRGGEQRWQRTGKTLLSLLSQGLARWAGVY